MPFLLNLINILLKTPPQSKNSNSVTTTIIKKYKVMPCWIIGVFY